MRSVRIIIYHDAKMRDQPGVSSAYSFGVCEADNYPNYQMLYRYLAVNIPSSSNQTLDHYRGEEKTWTFFLGSFMIPERQMSHT